MQNTAFRTSSLSGAILRNPYRTTTETQTIFSMRSTSFVSSKISTIRASIRINGASASEWRDFRRDTPSTPNRLLEMDYLKAKADAGADYIVTQLFFDNRDFYDFRERCELAGIRAPIVAGIMPITSSKGLERMSELALGSRFPARLLKAIDRCDGDEKYVRKVGVQWAAEQCRDLLDNGVRGLHFYTLNRSTATREIYASLGVKSSHRLAL